MPAGQLTNDRPGLQNWTNKRPHIDHSIITPQAENYLYLRQEERKKRNGEPEKVEVWKLFQFLFVYISRQELMETNGQTFK